MAFDQDQDLIERVRLELHDKGALEEKKMFGGLAFILNGKLCVAVRNHQLLLHLRHEDYDEALTEKGANPMIHGERQIKGVVLVDKTALENDATLRHWIDRALVHNAAVTAKK